MQSYEWTSLDWPEAVPVLANMAHVVTSLVERNGEECHLEEAIDDKGKVEERRTQGQNRTHPGKQEVEYN